jgi:tRNA nucleotidyltransferase (CCA-adding enzyme)
MSGSAAVVVRRTSYPQVDPRATGLMHRAFAVAPARIEVADALRLAERRRAQLVAARVGPGWAGATRDTLARAVDLGVGKAPLVAVLWDAPLLAPDASEVVVRRRLGPDRPFVLVSGPRGLAGVVLREPASPPSLPLTVASRLERLDRRSLEILRLAGTLGDTLGLPVAGVGGLVRDLLLGRTGDRTDLDLVVEGSASAVAHRLAQILSGHAVEHATFLTATVALPDGRRIDVTTARSESYRAPGALPSVEPASLADDLARRDFSLNALAIRLDRAAWGRVVDTTGGLSDLRARRIRVLHPCSFLEDPTRILRAARLSVRLGCQIDGTTRRLARQASQLDVYRDLSGDRLRAELELILAERRPAAALGEADRLGLRSLLGRGSNSGRPGGPIARRLGAALVPRALETLGPDAPLALALLALAGDGTGVDVWAGRLALPPAARDAIRPAARNAPDVLARLARARGPSAAFAVLQGAPEVTLAWARSLAANGRVRRYLDAYLRRWRRLPPLATGDDLAALGVPPGPGMGALLRELRGAQAAGRVRNRAGALRWLQGAVARDRGRKTASLTRPGKGGG